MKLSAARSMRCLSCSLIASEIICDGEEIFLNKVEYKAYIAGATAELERSEKLLQEYREATKELILLIDETQVWMNDNK